MKLLTTGAFSYSEEQIETLKSLGVDVYFMQHECETLPISAKEIDAVICNGLFLYHELSDFSKLRYIQLTSAGFDRVPLEKIESRGIIIKNARGVYSVPMAEWVVCKVLDIYKGTAYALERQREHTWGKNRKMREIVGKKVAVLGAGSVGSEVSRRFKSFGAEVIGYDTVIFENKAFDSIRIIDNFPSEICEFDIIIITLPLTEKTRGMIDRNVLDHLKIDAVLVNIARGAIVDAKALIEVLCRRTDISAILDVFDPEPLEVGSPLWDMPNVIVSPHNSFVSDGNNARMFNVIFSNLKYYIENK